MLKILLVAWRDFKAVVFTKSFAFGVFFPPALMVLVFALMPLLMNKAAPRVTGHIAVIDRSGVVTAKLEPAFSPEELAKRAAERAERFVKESSKLVGTGAINPTQAKAAAAALPANEISLRALDPSADPEAEKESLKNVNAKSGANTPDTRLALAVIPPDAVVKTGETFGGFDLFVAPKLDAEVQSDLTGQINRAIVDARLEKSGLDADTVREIMARPETKAVTITAGGERKTSEIAQFLVPFGFLMLLWISVFTAGQYLLTSTVEEKSTRVMEILLSAVSPMQLMVGKIVGNMAVGLLVLVTYTAMGGGLLIFRDMGHLLDPVMLLYFVAFFIIAFFLIASMMAAIGSAVNEMREAQSLLGPVMIVLIIPMVLWMPIMRNPNSTFAVVCSYLPPINPFVMVLRLGGSEKIPHWQVWLSIGVGALSAVVAAWAAAKIFRVGVLMYGKPPNLPTLIRWIRMA